VAGSIWGLDEDGESRIVNRGFL